MIAGVFGTFHYSFHASRKSLARRQLAMQRLLNIGGCLIKCFLHVLSAARPLGLLDLVEILLNILVQLLFHRVAVAVLPVLQVQESVTVEGNLVQDQDQRVAAEHHEVGEGEQIFGIGIHLLPQLGLLGQQMNNRDR